MPPESVQVLEAVGKWLDTNGRAIYETERGDFQRQPEFQLHPPRQHPLYRASEVWPGHTPAAEWLIFFQPEAVIAIGGVKPKVTAAKLLKTGKKVAFTQDEFSLRLSSLPVTAPDSPSTVIELQCDGEPAVDHGANRPLWPRYKSGISA